MTVRRGAVTIYAVAQRAGVSIATVSRVMRGTSAVSDRTRERVLQAVAELHYVPSGAASSLATQRQPSLGLVLPHLSGEYYAGVLVGFELAAAEFGYSVSLTLANSRADVRATVRSLAERVDGLAFLARSAAGDALVRELAGSRAVVTLARGVVDGVPSVASQGRRTAARLVDHLLATGRRRILFVGTPAVTSDVAERHRGYLDAHVAAGLEPAPVVEAELDEDDGREAAERLLAGGLRADALVCGNDLVALALMRRLQTSGVRVPDDVAVTGWDDIFAARYVSPALTTVNQHVQDIGRAAALRLHEQLTQAHVPAPDGRPDPSQDPHTQTTVFDSHVVYRESCCSDAAQHGSSAPLSESQ
ncbi:MAG: LacI family DNA-binding transcriptional regulator [Actinomycetes bacterium]